MTTSKRMKLATIHRRDLVEPELFAATTPASGGTNLKSA
jgi:hypothetical protein